MARAEDKVQLSGHWNFNLDQSDDAAQKVVWDQAYWIFLWHAPLYAGLSNRIEYQLRPDDYVEIYLAKPRS